ncbi:MAG: putative signal peptide protein [Actinomycetota bacterium]|jgi:redox-sensitive bicupin YhaK (pirin superfamily)
MSEARDGEHLVHDAKAAEVGGFRIRRALPRRGMRTVGAWCFADHMGPEVVTETSGLDVGPHPHIGLQTVTWLVEGAVLHTDSLGSEQLIRPGQLNLMTAGRGIVHAEESVRAQSTSGTGASMMHGVQLWVAQPSATRGGASDFAHHADLPRIDVGHGSATVFIGEYADAVSPARTDTPLVGIEADLRAGASRWSLRPDFEYAVYVISGDVVISGAAASTDTPPAIPVIPAREGQLVDLRVHRDELTIDVPHAARLLLLGGEPLGEPLYMWWNFVGRSREEIVQASSDWAEYVETGARSGSGTARFDRVASTLAPIAAPALV